ncbi:hypothetical protein OOK41_03880 [Micromonospora sp. NBC_01655]|uniref:hypothetical protein n=1 Tax=Micromonospora sp. NBC_01655 TaxID=2975983 RepID=UPI0022553373|nr:hypothetical protein [Micromonospora sp. NBC_01655]MCX4469450.1 hypothetical protein [Micromonospora sp. NBC_01655]
MELHRQAVAGNMVAMADRVMFVQLKTGHGTDKGPAWISRVRFSKSWQTAYWQGKRLRRDRGLSDANFYDVDTGEEYWLSGPHRDRADTRYSGIRPQIDDDVRPAYEAFLRGDPLPGREHG